MTGVLKSLGAAIYWSLCFIAETGLVPDWLIRLGIRHFLNLESKRFRLLARTTGTAALEDAFVASILDKPSAFQAELPDVCLRTRLSCEPVIHITAMQSRTNTLHVAYPSIAPSSQ
jgi:hypothetical protein